MATRYYSRRKIIEFREARGWSQSQLAEAASLTTAQIMRIEGGYAPQRRILQRLAAALNVDYEDLRTGIEDE